MKLKEKIFYAIDLLKARVLNKRFPLAVSWHLTYRCNYNCIYCDIPHMNGKKELSTSEVYSVIDGLKELGTKRIHFCGGESLLREDFSAIVDYCRSKSIETGLISNGALIPRYAKYLRNLTLLKLSLDGPADAHDRLRGAGAYGKVMEAVESANKEGITTVFNCTLSSTNLPYVEFVVDKSRELKIPVKFSPLNCVHAGNKDISVLLPEPGMYKEKMDYIKEEAKKNRYILNSISALRYISSFPAGRRIKHCIAGKIFCHIKPDGSVYLCERVLGEDAPNCKREGIKKAFYSLPLPICDECWCTSTLELNLIYSFDVSSLLKALEGNL